MSIQSDWQQKSDELPSLISHVQSSASDAMNAYLDLHQAAFKEGVLTAQTKELIAVAISIANHSDGCITSHVQKAIEVGCSREAVAEVVGVAIVMGGGPSVYSGARVLEAYDQLSASKAAPASNE